MFTFSCLIRFIYIFFVRGETRKSGALFLELWTLEMETQRAQVNFRILKKINRQLSKL